MDETIAEVWFKPKGEALALAFRVPRKSFPVAGMGQRWTPEILLNAVGIVTDEVEAWCHGGISHSSIKRSISDLGQPLPPVPQDVTHLTIVVRLKPPPATVAPSEKCGPAKAVAPPEACQPARAVAPPEQSEPAPAVAVAENGQPENLEATWQELEARWKAIEGLEATVETLRLRLEGLRTEMEDSLKKSLTTEEKVHALGADLSRWNKAKSRVHYAIPKVREFIHRATWATGTPERKRLEEIFKSETRPDMSLALLDKLREELENLLKNRQVLTAQGVMVQQECESISTDVQTALSTLQSNAATRARKDAHASRAGGKFFKDVRRLSGAD